MIGFATTKGRICKAKKIEAVLRDYLKVQVRKFRILDVGTGNGEIANYFADDNFVYCTDIEDQRTNKKRTNFKKVDSEKIPMSDNYFDIVLYNHVIEHVSDQVKHLKEIKRVLKKNGICYFATPNRIFPVEPHYKIPFIHYFPNKVFHKLLRLSGKYKEELRLLSYFRMKYLISDEFSWSEYTHKIIKYPRKYYYKVPLLSKLPIGILERINFISPTNIFILKKNES